MVYLGLLVTLLCVGTIPQAQALFEKRVTVYASATEPGKPILELTGYIYRFDKMAFPEDLTKDQIASALQLVIDGTYGKAFRYIGAQD